MHLTNFIRLLSSLSIVAFWAALSFYCEAQSNPMAAKGQVANLVRPEYYTGIDFLADSQSSQAALVLEGALSQSRMVNNQRGIDSIPPLVKLGECLLEQCDIGMALEKYDAALQISLLHTQRWILLLKPSTGNIRPENRNRDVPWSGSIRGTQAAVYNEVWPIALGSNDMLLESAAGQEVAGKMVAIDAMEILRCQAIALRRRYQLLGPLAKHSPLNDPVKRPLLNVFSLDVGGQSEVIQAAMNICRALAGIGMGDRVASSQLLNQNLTVGNNLDHPLTAIALLALADLAIDSNEILLAEDRAIEASIVAGRAGQMDHLAEALEYLSIAGIADGHDAAVGKMTQQIVLWSTNKSRMVRIRGQVEMARLSALAGDIETANKQCAASTTLLLPKQVVMPRAESVVRFSQAKIAFQEGNVSEGISKIVEGIAYLRGSENGIGSPALFQLDLALSLTKNKVLSDAVAEAVLVQLLRSPSAGLWRLRPIEQLDWLLVDKSEALKALLDIQMRTRTDLELVSILDDHKRSRYRRLNELEARVFDLQLLFHGDNRFVTNPTTTSQLRKLIPVVDQNVAKIQQLIAPLQANPKWDSRKWSPDDSSRWESAVRLSAAQEALLWGVAISPLVVAETFPPRHSQEFFAKSLQATDAVVMFVSQPESMRGYLFVDSKWQSWEVADHVGLERKLNTFVNDMLLLKTRDGDPNGSKVDWGSTRLIEIRNQLFPKKVWESLHRAERWIVVPDGSLWYFPLEMLPQSDQPNSFSCISEHRVTYSPTLGLVPFLLDAKPSSKSIHGIDVHVNDFLSTEGPRARELRENLATQKRFVMDLEGKLSPYPSSHFIKVASDCIHTYAPMAWESIAPATTDQNPAQSNIRMWSRLPWGTPSTLWLAGVNAVPPPPQANGDEWLRLTLPLIAQGTKQITVSRWPVGGESTASLLQSFQDNQESLSISESWQRSVLTLWEERFDSKTEPLFKGAPFVAPENTLPGSHPLLWSGYIRIGDSR